MYLNSWRRLHIKSITGVTPLEMKVSNVLVVLRGWTCYSRKETTRCQGNELQRYLVNKPLPAAGMSADNVRGWEIVRKMNIWPRSEASRANVKFWGQSLSQGHYQPTYQQARKGFIYFIPLPLIFISQLTRKHGKKSQLWSDAHDWREGAK